ncbi:MAG TPA: Fe-S cluster assembly protein SufD [Oligoflexus sp.]|uniref:Fe-S cluster assembly protein SufD n=1 Tax=Oligoflexus sp. TaxID=1971216 RepID=UPI002D39AE35|nr:Fe-S cluster assembly protein SufD [Oligoflexus sp.]HYX32071.1 Fe-S cluster assembly protein SufD [Oligoflexus sp.]
MQANIDKVYASVQGSDWTPAWIQPMRASAFQKFSQLGFPTRQNEDWKYTSLRSVTGSSFSWLDEAHPETDKDLANFMIPGADTLVFLNGSFAPHKSHMHPESGLTVVPLHKALKTKKDQLQAQLLHDATLPRGSFEELNDALFSSGAFIQVEAHHAVERPLQFLFLNTESAAAQLISPKNIISIADGASATVVESFFSYLEPHLTNAVSTYEVGRGARLSLFQEKILSSQSLHVGLSRIRARRDAQVECFTLTMGGRLSRSEVQVDLQEPGASVKLDGLYLGRMQSHLDHVTTIQHLAPHTTSSQVYKGILYDECRAIFNGRVNIVKNAQQSAAHQLNKNLLMSSAAEVDSRPQLKIDADDVKCSHGATIGQLDATQVFYLQSRGIPRAEAEQMLAKAFVRDVMYRIQNAPMQTRMLSLLENYGGITV